MISAKIQIDTLIRSNKIVLFMKNSKNVSNTFQNNRIKSEEGSFRTNPAFSSSKNKLKQNSLLTNPVTRESRNTLDKEGYFYFDSNGDIYRKSSVISKANSGSDSQFQIIRDYDFKFDIMQFLYTYGISKDYISVIYINELNHSNECEIYLKKYFCNDQIIKYPLVFIHGVYFGSDEEMLLGHTQGFLYDLFRDTGLYNVALIKKHFDFENTTRKDEDEDDDDDDYDSNDEEEDKSVGKKTVKTKVLDYDDDDYENEDEDEFAIRKVAKINSKDGAKMTKSSASTKNLTNNPFLMSNYDFSYKASRFFRSEYDTESLLSVDKESYCQKYINNLNQQHVNISKIANKNTSSLFQNSSKFSRSPLISPTLSSTPNLRKAQVKENNRKSHKNNATGKRKSNKVTDPSDVLATINKWLKQTQQVIDIRNKIIASKNNFNFT